jgi:hypothetical protein
MVGGSDGAFFGLLVGLILGFFDGDAVDGNWKVRGVSF